MKYTCSKCGNVSDSFSSYAIEVSVDKKTGGARTMSDQFTCQNCHELETSSGEMIRLRMSNSPDPVLARAFGLEA